MKTICVIGLGYIGLPTASLFATNRYQVYGVDTNPSVVETINKGKIHIEEAGLRTLVEAAVVSGKLKASTYPVEADAFIIAVPTPIDREKRPDLTHVYDAVRAIAPRLRKGNLIILESTVSPRTTLKVAEMIGRERPDLVGETGDPVNSLKVLVAHCPERVLPGSILKELVENDRVVGGVTQRASGEAAALYAGIVSGRIYQTDATTAEMVKLSENTFRDVNISLANELAVVCEELGIDAWEVIGLANRHPRVRILSPGPGVGGHCIAVDPWFIISEFPKQTSVMRSARERNDAMPQVVVARVQSLIAGQSHPKIACLGASYKGNVGDSRNSPAVTIFKMLCDALGSTGTAVISDSHLTNTDLPLQPLDDVLKGASLILVLADHDEFRALDPFEVASTVRVKKVLDTRNTLDHARWQNAGFDVYVLGKGKAKE